MDNQKRIFYLLKILFIFTFLYFHIPQCIAQERMKGPFNHKSINHFEKYGKGKNILLNFYQKWISPVKGGNKCPMHPSCSQYAKIAFQVLPWYKACTKSFERLLRCGRELYLYPTVQINRTMRWNDPLVIKESQNEYKITEANFYFIFNNNNLKY